MDLNHFKKLVDLNFHISSSGKLFSGTVHTASIAFQGVVLKLRSTQNEHVLHILSKIPSSNTNFDMCNASSDFFASMLWLNHKS